MQGNGSSAPGLTAGPATRIVIRSIVYYAILIGGTTLLWQRLPAADASTPQSLDLLLGGGAQPARAMSTTPLGESSLALTVGVAMLAAVLLTLPVAWVYLVTRAKRGYQQSVVQLLLILPMVVAGIVLLVKYSLALAFSLAGIVAAVRFRNTLEDSKDAVYVFLATAIGLACAVNLPVAAVISIGFNMLVLVLWYTDFGIAPMELDGRLAQRRLKRARELARTGTFVARMDDEVLQNMTRDQLEGVAQRAWRRASALEGDAASPPEEVRLRVHTTNVAALRSSLEPRLQEFTKQWRAGATSELSAEGTCAVDYHIQLRKRAMPEELVALARAACGEHVLEVEVL